jgi:hypothetical protein
MRSGTSGSENRNARPARRRFLKSMGAVALAPLLGGAGLAAATPAAAAAGAAGPLPAVVPLGRMFLVNGWLLTRADLEALGLPC